MECSYCHKVFHKGEHLRRHERSHTGARPFVCKHCKRPFSRQDSLLRHERLHARLENAKSPLSGQSAPGPVTPESLSTAEVDAENHASPYVTASAQVQDQSQMNGHFQQNPTSTELGFELMWPDSEYLFQTIMSPNTLAFPSDAPPSEFSVGTPSSTFDERVPSIDSIPSGGNHKAVHDVSKMIASWSSSVTTAAESNSIHSVFLDECLHMFFVRFIPTFPILHRATFVFRDCIHPLLLNAIAIGSLYLGPKDAITKGEVLWRLAHTAVATSWQSLINHRGPFDACQGVQLVITALLGQVYGSLSKNRTIRTMSQSFHGLGFTWANYLGMFDSEPYATENLPQPNTSKAEKDHQWRTWVARDIQQRALLAHYMLDGLIAQMSGKATTIRHASNQLTLLGNEAAFAAGNSDDWLSIMTAQPTTQPKFRSVFHMLFSPVNDHRWLSYSYSAISLRVLLEGVQSLLSDCDENGEAAVGLPSKNEIRRSLARIHETISQSVAVSSDERLETLLRWHVISLDAIANTPLLGKCICRRYAVEQHIWANVKGMRPGPDLGAWATSADARRAMLHAAAIQDIVEQLPRGRAHAIHFPSSLFAAATVYTLFLLAGSVTVRLPAAVDWAEVVYPANDPCVALAELAGTVFASDTSRYIRGEPMAGDVGAAASPAAAITTAAVGVTRNLLYEFNSIQKLFGCLNTQWGIAGDMEKVIDKWITLCH